MVARNARSLWLRTRWRVAAFCQQPPALPRSSSRNPRQHPQQHRQRLRPARVGSPAVCCLSFPLCSALALLPPLTLPCRAMGASVQFDLCRAESANVHNASTPSETFTCSHSCSFTTQLSHASAARQRAALLNELEGFVGVHPARLVRWQRGQELGTKQSQLRAVREVDHL